MNSHHTWIAGMFITTAKNVGGGVKKLFCPSFHLSVQFCPVHIFLIEKHWKFLLTQRCFWLEDVSWFWIKFTWASSRSLEGKCKFVFGLCPSFPLSVRLCKCVRTISFLRRKTESFYLPQRLLMTWGCVMILNQGHLSQFKVTRRKSAKFVSFLYLSHWETLTFFTLH